MSGDDFIGLPPGMLDSATFRATVRTDRPRTEKPDVVFVSTVPGMPVPILDPADPPPENEAPDDANPDDVTRRDLGDDFTVPSADADADADELGGEPAAAATWVLTLADDSTIKLQGATLLGRDPALMEPWSTAALVAIDDTTRSVSKTHAALEPDGSGLWVHDLHSTNGVWVVVDEDATEVAPGRRVAVPAGATIELGEYEIRVSLLVAPPTSSAGGTIAPVPQY